MGALDHWSLPQPGGTESGITFYAIGEGVRLFDVRGRWPDGFTDGAGEKIGYAVHHSVTGEGDGSLESDLQNLDNIARFHLNPEPDGRGWPGFAYHRAIGNGRRVFLTGSSAQQRAHVAGLNHRWIGVCLLGTFTNQRPDDERMATLRWLLQWETDQRGGPMLMAPHKRLNLGTECPGGWAAVDAWEGLQLIPGTPTPPPVSDAERIEHARRHVNEARIELDRALTMLG